MSKGKKLWADAGRETHTDNPEVAPPVEAQPLPAGPAWFRLVRVPNSNGCVAIEKAVEGRVEEVHQADMPAIAISKLQNFVLEELMK